MNCVELRPGQNCLSEEIRQLAERVEAVDPMALAAFTAIASAMVAGHDDATALEVGNAILIRAGRKPLPVPDLLVKMKQGCGGTIS